MFPQPPSIGCMEGYDDLLKLIRAMVQRKHLESLSCYSNDCKIFSETFTSIYCFSYHGKHILQVPIKKGKNKLCSYSTFLTIFFVTLGSAFWSIENPKNGILLSEDNPDGLDCGHHSALLPCSTAKNREK